MRAIILEFADNSVVLPKDVEGNIIDCCTQKNQQSQSTALSGSIVDLQRSRQAFLQTTLATLQVGSQELPV